MSIEIVVPRLGWSMEEGIFTEWLKKDGELVAEGDSLFVLEGEKASQDIESFDRGILRIPPEAPQPGDTVLVGQLLGYLCEEGEEIQTGDGSTAVAATEDAVGRSVAPSSPAESESDRVADKGDGNGSPVASPSVRRLAREVNVDLSQVSGSGKGGRVTREDVETAAGTIASSPTAVASEVSNDQRRLRISPRAARKAAELGVDARTIQGTGQGGRIRERDVLAVAQRQNQAVATGPTAGTAGHGASSFSDTAEIVSTSVNFAEVAGVSAATGASEPLARTIRISKLRETIAHRMLAGAQQAAPVTLTTTLDATLLVGVRQQLRAQAMETGDAPPSYTSLLVRLACTALTKHEIMTAQWTADGIVIPQKMNIAVAVDTEAGLYAPVLAGASSLRVREINLRLQDLAERTRQQKLSPGELQGGCFTITNLGMYGVDAFTPILNLPQSAILGVGRIAKQPMVVDDQVVPRDAMTLSLTFDHRVTDGAPAAAFLDTLRQSIEGVSAWSLM